MRRRSQLALLVTVVACATAGVPASVPPPPALERTETALAARVVAEGLSFEQTENLAVAWGLAPRSSAGRHLEKAAPGALRFDDDWTREIAASVYSLPSSFFSAAESKAFLAGVHSLAPKREILVLADPAAREALGHLPGVRTLPTFGRDYSPWPRDPLSLTRRADGGLAVLIRPNLQRGREEDANLGRALIQTLPADLDRRFKQPVWTVAGVPFHNGQALIAPKAVWISIHTLEPRILEILGVPRIPVETFGTAEGIDRYLAAAHRAADELGVLYGRPVRFVHPLPDHGELAARIELLRVIGGGAGTDLDSLVTLVPRRSGAADAPLTAFVADVAAGEALLGRLSPADLASVRSTYGFSPGADPAGLLKAGLATPSARGLGAFLDAVAAHLSAEGFEVRRLPLLFAPFSALARADELPEGGSFLIGWNNAVLETRGGAIRAEMFGSGLPTGDQEAITAYTSAGARLTLLPALPMSVIRGGGYRCASNHVR
ncbi:MAG TPA: hypothetical protein VN851_02950 [Thermoanaerobaculia bacterium]|nr:hypothetical protein [Thermoanaerobaculia bacterium]